MDTGVFIRILEKEMVPALGCTDPVGVAYGAAYTRSFLNGNVLSVHGELSTNIIKNAAAVCIPRTGGKCGVGLALALGVLCGNPDKGFEVLAEIDDEDVRRAEAMLARGEVTASVSTSPKKLHMKITVTTNQGEAVTIMEDSYTNVVETLVNGKLLFSSKHQSAIGAGEHTDGPHFQCEDRADSMYSVLSLENILAFAREVPIEQLGIIQEAIRMNLEIAEEGFANEYGVSLGRSIREYVANGKMGEGLASTAMMWAAAATDARMAGCDMPVMSNTGSGNQGLASTIPVISIAKKLGKSWEDTVRAVAISSLVTIYIKEKFGVMSAMCGVVIASVGTSCGIVYLLGGDSTQMLSALKSTFGDLSGMLCDGAKAGCAMKVATCTNTGVLAALIAMDNKGIRETDGIVGRNEIQTIDNFIQIATRGMVGMDNVILDIILKKEDSPQ